MCEPEQAAYPVPSDWVGLGLTKREEFAKAIAINDELLTQLTENDEQTA